MRKAFVFAALASVLAAPAAFADRDGHGRGWDKHHGNDKEEFWDGNCLVTRKFKHGEFEEKRKCKAPARVVVVPARPVVVPAPTPAVLVYPPWIVQRQGQYAYHPEYRPVRAPGSATRCNSDTVGRVLGGIVGGALGNQIGGGNGRTLATIGGAVAGVLVGGEVGRRMDARDQACVGEVLEVAPVGRRVQWVDSRVTYVVIPGRVVLRQGAHCRPYTLDMQRGSGWQRTEGWACRRPGGVWVAA
jgi:surface antigen